jgi:hypothetical protein
MRQQRAAPWAAGPALSAPGGGPAHLGADACGAARHAAARVHHHVPHQRRPEAAVLLAPLPVVTWGRRRTDK